MKAMLQEKNEKEKLEFPEKIEQMKALPSWKEEEKDEKSLYLDTSSRLDKNEQTLSPELSAIPKRSSHAS